MRALSLAGAVRRAALAFAAVVLVALPARADPTFPPLTGRVVDQANLLTPAQEAALSTRLEALETQTTDQVVVATVPSLQDYPIEEFGYQLGRHWGIGQGKLSNGVVLLVAPNERKVRIEVGYGLEPILTDALSSLIIQERILPKFREGDFPAGIDAGVTAIGEQLTLDPAEAKKRADLVGKRAAAQADGDPFHVIPGVLIFLLVLWLFMRIGGRGRRAGLLGAIASSAWSSGGSSGWSSGSGGGGFSGGGGSFGGGGSSGSW